MKFNAAEKSTIFPQHKLLMAYDEDDNLLGTFRYSRRRKSSHRRWKARLEAQNAKIVYTSETVTQAPKTLRPKEARVPLNTVPAPKQKAMEEITRLQNRILKLEEFIAQPLG